MSVVIVNMNQRATVYLTEIGKNILKEHYKSYPENVRPVVSDTFRTELWDLMSIFGQHIQMGCKVPFDKNRIAIEIEL